MKEEKKTGTTWEMVDPKPPVIQSGHMENRVQHLENPQEGVDKWGDLGL